MTDEERGKFIRYINDNYTLLMNKISYAIVKDEYLAEDVKQKVLIRLIPKAEILKPLHPKQIASYIATTTTNVAIEEYHKQKSYEERKMKLIENYKNNLTMNHIDFKAFEGEYGFSEDLWVLMRRLTPIEQNILVYTYHYELSTKEVAKLIGSNMEVVKKRLQRIRSKLANIIEEEGVDFYE